eukprot:gnl/Ergobibamus_cyprinoides/1313.p2 GENE.gnl/Ergobibamus_cyprinoides/1313~~gnl/Ergobibamus_cyprinoides/1313.p2  ORF type:complete len:206 (-),score=25.77 gnl/Ergobibamus_cyprinoides/1313:142-759(-)
MLLRDAAALPTLVGRRVFPRLCSLLDHPSADIAEHAAHCLKAASAYPEGARAVAQAVQSLDALPSLVSLLRSRHPAVSRAAQAALRNIASSSPAVQRQLQELDVLQDVGIKYPVVTPATASAARPASSSAPIRASSASAVATRTANRPSASPFGSAPNSPAMRTPNLIGLRPEYLGPVPAVEDTPAMGPHPPHAGQQWGRRVREP